MHKRWWKVAMDQVQVSKSWGEFLFYKLIFNYWLGNYEYSQFYAVWTSIPISKDPNDEPGRLKDRFLSHILNRLFLHYKPIRRMEVIFNISSKRHIAIVENAFHPKLVINILIVDSTTFDEKLEWVLVWKSPSRKPLLKYCVQKFYSHNVEDAQTRWVADTH